MERPPQSPAAQHSDYHRKVSSITWIGLVLNVLLAAGKIAAGQLGHSRAVFADGVHSISDLVTDLAVLIGVRFWSKPADANHPHGHSRIETLVTLGIGLALAATAAVMAHGALADLRLGRFSKPGWIAFGAAAASIVIKELLYRATMRTAQTVKSSALVANAWHHRTDALSSIPAAVAVAVGALAPGWEFVDALGALLVCVFIFKAAYDVGNPALVELMDRAAPPEIVAGIREEAMATPGVRDAHAIRSRYLGSALQIDLHVLVDPELTVREGHDIAHAVKRRLLDSSLDVADVVVHMEPADHEGPAT